MKFLNDKKNQPIIAAVAIIAIVGVGVFYYLQMRPQAPSSESTEMASVPAVAPAPSAASNPTPASPGAPAGGFSPGATPPGTPAPGAPEVGVADASGKPKPVEETRADPFKMLNPPRPPTTVRRVEVREPVPYPTWLIVPRKQTTRVETVSIEQMDQTPRRMAGIMYNGTVSAILEIGSDSIVVKPGDLIENETMRVEKIEPNRIVLRPTNNPKARLVEVKMAASQNVAIQQTEPTTSSAPSVNPWAGRTPGSPPGGQTPTNRGVRGS